MSAAARSEPVAEVPVGNTFDKYGSTNSIVRRLMAGFERDLGELFTRAAPDSVLDVGCGEAVLTARWAQWLGERRVVGFDLEDPGLAAHWERRARPNLSFVTGDAGQPLPFADGEFSLVAAIETLEHIPAPERLLAEMARVSASHLLVSVPHEPLWRALNVLRGAYVRRLGNTPGHVNHWTASGFRRLLGGYGEVIESRAPFPWTMLLVAVA